MSHQTHSFEALDFQFAVAVPNPALAEYLDRLFLPFRTDSNSSRHLYSLDQDDQSSSLYSVSLDGSPVLTEAEPDLALAHLLWHINRSVIDVSGRYLLVHAAAAEVSRRAILLPAPAGSGKSTLVAALVRAGLNYVTDEVVAFKPDSISVHPYPKSITLDPGSWGALSDMRPFVDPEVEPFVESQWNVEPLRIRSNSIADDCKPGAVVMPRFELGARADLQAMARSSGLALLAESAFNLESHGAGGFRRLAEVARSVNCYRLVFGNVNEASRLVVELLSENQPLPTVAGRPR